MSRQTVEEWLEWAEAKYEAAQERYAYGGRSDTMDQYGTLVSALEDAIGYRAGCETRGCEPEPVGPCIGRVLENMRLVADSGMPAGPSQVRAWATELKRAHDELRYLEVL